MNVPFLCLPVLVVPGRAEAREGHRPVFQALSPSVPHPFWFTLSFSCLSLLGHPPKADPETDLVQTV